MAMVRKDEKDESRREAASAVTRGIVTTGKELVGG